YFILNASGRRKGDKGLSAFVQTELAVLCARTHDFTFVWHVHEVIAHLARPASQRRIARTHDGNPVAQPHVYVHLETEVRDRLRGCFAEEVDCLAVKVVWKPPQRLGV